MAEFVEVIKNKNRMCEAQDSCGWCPLGKKKYIYNLSCPEIIKKHTEEAEETIMAWAKKHPIQTNEDKFEEVFGFKPEKVCLFEHSICNLHNCDNYDSEDCGEVWWNEEYKAPTDKNSILEDLKPRGSADMPKDIVCNCTEEQK